MKTKLALLLSLAACGERATLELPGDIAPPTNPETPDTKNACQSLEPQDTPPKTPTAQYIFPLIKGFASSSGGAWCVCRSGGSSPHIGQDYNNTVKPQDTSLAISNGVVKSVTLVGKCGWEVYFEDSHGARWRYLHLNKPTLAAGQQLWRGDIVGQHAVYPKEGCGSGPHLHLERRKAGQHGGDFTKKSCEAGPEDCYYDPVSLLRGKRVVQDEEDRKKVVKESKGETTGDPASPKPAPETPASPICVACNPHQPPAVAADNPTITKGTEGLLKGHAGFVRDSEGKRLLVVEASLGSEDNRCDGKSECLVSWEVQVRGENGSWWKLFSARGIQNHAAKLEAEQAYCLSSELGTEYRIVALSDRRRTYVARGELDALSPQ